MSGFRWSECNSIWGTLLPFSVEGLSSFQWSRCGRDMTIDLNQGRLVASLNSRVQKRIMR